MSAELKPNIDNPANRDEAHKSLLERALSYDLLRLMMVVEPPPQTTPRGSKGRQRQRSFGSDGSPETPLNSPPFVNIADAHDGKPLSTISHISSNFSTVSEITYPKYITLWIRQDG